MDKRTDQMDENFEPILEIENSEKEVEKSYNKAEDYEAKKQYLHNLILNHHSEKDFLQTMEELLSAPEDYYFKLDLFSFFVQTFKSVAPNVYKERILNITFFQRLLEKCEYLVFLSIILLDYWPLNGPEQAHMLKVLGEKMLLMTTDQLNKNLFLETSFEYITYKKTKDTKAQLKLPDLRLRMMKQAVYYLYEGYFCHLATGLPKKIVAMALFQWLLILDPQRDILEYRVTMNIMNTLKNSIYNAENKISPEHFRTILVTMLDLLTMRFTNQDTFQGYKNLLILLEMIDSQALHQFVRSEVPPQDIMQLCANIDNLGYLLQNLVSYNLLRNSCVILGAFLEHFQACKQYDMLLRIFQQIVIPFLIPKIRVLRTFLENLGICEFFFYGLSKIGIGLDEKLLENFVVNLKFLLIEVCKNSDFKTYLSRYLDFLDVICYLYKDFTDNKPFFILIDYVRQTRLSFECEISEERFQEILSQAQTKVWEMTREDLLKAGFLSSVDLLAMNFTRNKKNKGIKNIGNTCYLASTMQALFMTEEFRTKVLSLDLPRPEERKEEEEEKKAEELTDEEKSEKLIEQLQKEMENENVMTIEGDCDIVATKSRRPKTDTLNETKLLFEQLIIAEDNYVDPYWLKQTLPDYLRLAHSEQDASEFLQIYFDCIEQKLKELEKEDLVNDLFSGETLTTWECQECFTPRTKKATYLHIGLTFSNKEAQHEDQLSLLKSTFGSDSFEGETALHCETCKKKSALTTQAIEILTVPKYLVFTLNRFYFNVVEQRGAKIFTKVDIHEEIDLKTVLNEQIRQDDAKYQLYAIVIHKGLTTENGHYFTFVRDTEDENLWILCNDSMTYSLKNGVTLQNILSEYEGDTPYLLFYKKVVPVPLPVPPVSE